MKKPALSELTLREKIGQTVVFRSDTYQWFYATDKEYFNLIGGVWIWGALDMSLINMGNVTTNVKLHSEATLEFMQNVTKDQKIPVIGCMDNAGGLKFAFDDLSPAMDLPMIGATGSAELSYKMGECKARELKCAGARWMWGPEEDLANRNSSISLYRKFSDNPDVIIELAKAQNKGVQAHNVVATAKHFPGDDEMEYRDPHVSQSIMRLSKEDWFKRQGRVFQEVFDDGVMSVMIGHQSFPAVDNRKINGTYLPAVVSDKIVTDLLKGEMGFKGVVITDGIAMEGSLGLYGGDIDTLCVESLKAGCDVILGAGKNYINAVEKAVLEGYIPESRVDDACQRVLDMKEKIGLFETPVEPVDKAAVLAASAETNQAIIDNGMSLVCDRNNMLPLTPEKAERVTIVYVGDRKSMFDDLDIMVDELYKQGVKTVAKQIGVGDPPDPQNLSANSDIILYVGDARDWGMAGFRGETFKTFYRVTMAGMRGRRIGVSINSPYLYFDYFEGFDCFINVYNEYEATQRSFIQALFGKKEFKGGHPFKLIPDGMEVNY